ncbi:MAG: hypothetical protein JNK67_08320 [Alphaproteobacteria bacterium]|nr:hypothetical protein [Alphaproteobacteria bacterium]
MSLPHNATAVVARNEVWQGSAASEPYECGWAREAIVFVRALEAPVKLGRARARVQVSPDGIRWLDHGKPFSLPARKDAISAVPVTHFGNWLRVAADLPKGGRIKLLVTIHLKA